MKPLNNEPLIGASLCHPSLIWVSALIVIQRSSAVTGPLVPTIHLFHHHHRYLSLCDLLLLPLLHTAASLTVTLPCTLRTLCGAPHTITWRSHHRLSVSLYPSYLPSATFHGSQLYPKIQLRYDHHLSSLLSLSFPPSQ
jgi:hypothetical protein